MKNSIAQILWLPKPTWDQVEKILGKTEDRYHPMLVWLRDQGILYLKRRKKPGRKAEKIYSWAEHRRAERAYSWDDGSLSKSTMKRYGSVLGNNRRYDKEPYFAFNLPNLFKLLEQLFGLPTGGSATDFARKSGLPTRIVKAWVRSLKASGRICVRKIRGRRILRLVTQIVDLGGVLARIGALPLAFYSDETLLRNIPQFSRSFNARD